MAGGLQPSKANQYSMKAAGANLGQEIPRTNPGWLKVDHQEMAATLVHAGTDHAFMKGECALHVVNTITVQFFGDVNDYVRLVHGRNLLCGTAVIIDHRRYGPVWIVAEVHQG